MTTEPELVPPARRGPSLGLRFLIAFFLGVVLVVGAGGGALYAYGQQYTGRVLPGVHVGETDLSGLSIDAATAALGQAYGTLGSGQVLLAGPDGDLTIGYAAIGRGPDITRMLDAAMAAGRLGEPVADLIGGPQTAIRGVVLEPAVTFDPAKLATAVAAVAEAVDRNPIDATITIGKDLAYATTPSVDGRLVDRAALAASIGAQLARLDAPSELRLEIPFATAGPAVSTAAVDAAKAAAERMAQDIVLRRGADTWVIKAASIRKLISFATAGDGSVVPVVDEEGIDPLLAAIASSVNQTAQSATFKLSGNRVQVAGPSKEGRKFDTAATHAVILDALMARQAGTPESVLGPVVAATEPGVTTAEAEAIAPKMREISRWKTFFHVYVNNGFGANIWIPSKLVNGHVVAPGETFDFWKVVGTPTRAAGYKQGGAIINGKTEPQGALAGGICSCSTTLFNAALRGGMAMGARRNHYYYIDRYPLGLDATVFISNGGSKQTMSWTNDTDYPVLIRGINTRSGNSGWVTFVLYSVPAGRKVVISPATVKNRHAATDTRQLTSSLPRGTTKRVEYPVNGMDVWRTVTVSEGGKVLRSTTYYSHYSTVTGILLVGTSGSGGGTKPTPSPTPSPTTSPPPAAAP
jgi:vancomycin resistance protein YoaR